MEKKGIRVKKSMSNDVEVGKLKMHQVVSRTSVGLQLGFVRSTEGKL